MRHVKLAIAFLGLLLVANAASAAIYTFDSSADLTNNFFLDVVAGDNLTQWRTGYSTLGGFPASDGGFVIFNQYNTGNSIAFKSGPVLLNSFTISSQFDGGGAGVSNAVSAANDYRLILYDSGFNELLNVVKTVPTGGVWGTETFNLANVYAIRITRRDGDGTGTGGWWPNIDNIRVNEVQAVPEPASCVIWGALGIAGLVAARRRKKVAA